MAIKKLTWDVHPLSTIMEQEEPDTKGDNCERPEARQMQYISLAVCYCNQASYALFFGA